MIHLKCNSRHATTSLYGGTNSNIYKTIIFLCVLIRNLYFFAKTFGTFQKILYLCGVLVTEKHVVQHKNQPFLCCVIVFSRNVEQYNNVLFLNIIY